LQTVNRELQIKVDDLSRLNNDIHNLLDSTDIATLFLDNALRVRMFTTTIKKIFRLIPSDVGRPIMDIASDLLYPELEEDTREMLRTLNFHEKQVATRDGRWLMVRIMPYRTLENIIDGAVITFSDITVAKTLEAELRRSQTGLQNRIDEQNIRLEKSDADLRIEKQRVRGGDGDGTASASDQPEESEP
jgi:two-component system CheB/CheR fusion protein